MKKIEIIKEYSEIALESRVNGFIEHEATVFSEVDDVCVQAVLDDTNSFIYIGTIFYRTADLWRR